MYGLDCLKWLVPGDTDASWQRMTDAAAGMGFDKVVLIVLPFAGASFDLARKWSSGVPGWTALYRQRQFDRVDPMLRHCFRSALPLVWDDALFALPEQRPCYEAAAAYGMRSGVVLPVQDETWEWDGETSVWSRVATSGVRPSARCGSSTTTGGSSSSDQTQKRSRTKTSAQRPKPGDPASRLPPRPGPASGPRAGRQALRAGRLPLGLAPLGRDRDTDLDRGRPVPLPSGA